MLNALYAQPYNAESLPCFDIKIFLSGDYLFNEAVKKDKRSEKVIQENQIQIHKRKQKKHLL